MPGRYTVVLTANGKSYSEPLTIDMDPRVKAPLAGLQQQFELSRELYTQLLSLAPEVERALAVRKQLADAQKQTKGRALAAVKALDEKLLALVGTGARRPGPGPEPLTLSGLRKRYLDLFEVLQGVDEPPTTQATSAVVELEQQLAPLMKQWRSIKDKEIPALNEHLKRANLPELKLEAAFLSTRAPASAKHEDEE